jgi:hypothetical protein
MTVIMTVMESAVVVVVMAMVMMSVVTGNVWWC